MGGGTKQQGGSEVRHGEKRLGNSSGILVLPQASAQAIRGT